MTPNSVFRARAREQLGGNIFSPNWLMGLVVLFVAGLIVSIAASILPGVGFFIAGMAEGFLYFGISQIFLSLVRGKKKTIDIGDMFIGGNKMGDLILLGLLKNLFITLWGMLFVIPGVIKSYSYAMAYYIKYDHPEYDWQTCITESRKMMDGHKWRLFCLDFSFIGWIIVGTLCCGIGTLWVKPYQEAAHANFYDDLKAHYEPAPIVVEELPVAEEGADDNGAV